MRLFIALSVRDYPLTKIRIATLVVACLAPYIQAARSSDLPLKTRHSHERVIDRSRQGDIDPIAKEILFQQFFEWMKKRTDHDQGIPQLRSSFTQ
jgi:hypothetical protein